MATFGDGMIAFAIAFMFVGFFWCLTNIDDDKTDYEVCLNKCPKSSWDSTFEGFECPKMCKNILNKDANCVKGEQDE